MLACDFPKYRDIPRDDRQIVLCSLNQRESETFTFTGGDQASAGCIDLFKVFIANTFEPEQALAKLGMAA